PIPRPATSTRFPHSSGPAGTSVTVTSTNFTGASAVTFNAVSASFTVISDTAIQATVPTGARTGPLSVTTPGGTATSTNNFTVTVTLTVTKAGSGTVTSSDGAINCGTTCSSSYTSGTTVTLTATPASGSIFTGWSGCDAVSGTTCSVTMSAARAVTAPFTLPSCSRSFAYSPRICSLPVPSTHWAFILATTRLVCRNRR